MIGGIRTTGDKIYIFCGKPKPTEEIDFKDFYVDHSGKDSLLFVEKSEALPYLSERLSTRDFMLLLERVTKKMN